MQFFATAAKGTEPALRDELRELGFEGVRADRGGVHFEGEMLEGRRACLWSRIAIRVLSPLASFPAPEERAYYDGVHAIDLDSVLTPKHTLVVSSACRSSRITHTEYLEPAHQRRRRRPHPRAPRFAPERRQAEPGRASVRPSRKRRGDALPRSRR